MDDLQSLLHTANKITPEIIGGALPFGNVDQAVSVFQNVGSIPSSSISRIMTADVVAQNFAERFVLQGN